MSDAVQFNSALDPDTKLPSGEVERRSEAHQAASREIQQILQAIPDAIVIIDRHWNFTFANTRAIELLNQPDVIGHNIFKLYPGNLEEPFYSSYRKTMAERVPTEFEAFYEGSLKTWFKVQARPLEDDGIILFFSDITERKLAELREQQTAQRLAQVMNVTSDAILALDRNWHLTYLNDKAKQLLGVDDRILGRIVWEEFPHAGPLRQIYDRSMDLDLSGQTILFYPEPLNGWFEVHSEPATEGIVVFFRDITERKLHDDQMREQQDLLTSVQAAVMLATWELDLRSGTIRYGAGSYPVYGHPLASLPTRDAFLNIVHPEDRHVITSAMTHIEQTGEQAVLDFRVLATDGSIIPLEARAQIVRDSAGRATGLRGLALNNAERKRSESALREQQTQAERRRTELETVYRTSPVGLALLDPVHFTFLNLNDQEADMLGLPKDDILGRSIREIAPPDKLPGFFELMCEVAGGKHVRDHLLEGELAARPGERRAWSVNYSPVYNEDGSIRAISTASIEITNQKRAEAALIQSEKLAAVGRLASSISHEINNPLEAITNLLYLVGTDGTLPEHLKLYVQMAQSELSRVSQIATQTLRFHRQAVAPTHVTAQDLVGAVVQLYAGRLANSGIRVFEHYRTHTHILCFENDIRQVFNNLIANAIDAMRPGGGKLVIRAHSSTDYAVPEGRTGVRITIADTGHGMSPATLLRVFEPFFTTKDLQGTGLGLWISKGIVERHQGKLSVRSSQDQRHHGTLFTLFLPCHEIPSSAESVSIEPTLH